MVQVQKVTDQEMVGETGMETEIEGLLVLVQKLVVEKVTVNSYEIFPYSNNV